MSGHGHVIPRPDGAKARCGGPALCSVCAAELAQVRREEAAASALLSLAAELDSLAARPKLPGLSDEAYGYGSGIFQGAAEMARQRATNGPGTPLFGEPASGEDLELTGGLSPAQAYMAGVKAERERIRQQIDAAQIDKLADWFDTDDEFKVAMFPGTWPERGREVQDDLRRWARVLRGEVPGDG